MYLLVISVVLFSLLRAYFRARSLSIRLHSLEQEIMAVGINAIREVCARCPLAMERDLMQDLVQVGDLSFVLCLLIVASAPFFGQSVLTFLSHGTFVVCSTRRVNSRV